MTALARDDDHEVVGVADEPVGRLTSASTGLALSRVGSHRLPCLGEVLVQDRQRDVGQQRGEDPALRGAGDRAFEATVLGKDPGVQERLDERQHALVFDPVAHAVHQGHVVDAVKARLDVGLDHPLVGAGGEVLHLGDRVLRPASRPEPV